MDLYRYKNDSENKKNILRIIYREGGISRNDLIERTGLSLPTVIKFVTEFIGDNAVEEFGTLESTGGRKSSRLRVKPDFAYIVGIDVGAYSIKLGVVRINGEIVEKEIMPWDQEISAGDASLDKLCTKIQGLLDKHGKDNFIGIGTGISGMVDRKGNVIFCPNISGWDGISIVEILQQRFGVPVFADTSSRCMALAEQWFGAGKGVENQVFVSIGYSIGSGIIVDSQVFKGSGGFSGELGHTQVSEDGIRCTCGNYGCLELYATLPMIIQDVKKRIEAHNGYSPIKTMIPGVGGINRDVMAQALEKGDKVVYEAVMDVGRLIGIALANLANILNPELIILGGGVIENFPVIVGKIERTIKERALVTIQQSLSVRKSLLGWDGPVKGSAVMVIRKFLE